MGALSLHVKGPPGILRWVKAIAHTRETMGARETLLRWPRRYQIGAFHKARRAMRLIEEPILRVPRC